MRTRLLSQVEGKDAIWLRAEVSVWFREPRIAFKRGVRGLWFWEDTGEEVGLWTFTALEKLIAGMTKQRDKLLAMQVHEEYCKDMTAATKAKIGIR